MVNEILNQYEPDHVSPPGATLLETIEALSISQSELATRLGLSKKCVNEIVQGKAPITPTVALCLERVLGAPARFWNNREQHYREFLAKENEQEQLKDSIEWLKKFPINALKKIGIVKEQKNKIRQLQELLQFLGVASPDQYSGISTVSQIAFRKARSYVGSHEALTSWLRIGELEAQSIVCNDFNKTSFRESLSEVRSLTGLKPHKFTNDLQRICAASGVAVVLVPELPKTGVSGAARWLSPSKAVIQLSLRYKANDRFWFSFFHEAGHLILHGKKPIYVENDNDLEGEQEEEADRFASETLIPRIRYRNFILNSNFSRKSIQDFSDSINLAPGIVLGRLQFDNHVSWPSKLNATLKVKF